jgi:uncharacterized protein YkwD
MKKIQNTYKAITFLGLVLVVAIVGCGGGSDPGIGNSSGLGDAKSQAAANVDATCGRPNFNADALALINARRAAGAVCGGVNFPPANQLVWNNNLRNSATVHALDLADRSSLPQSSEEAHTGSDGTSSRDRIARAGFTPNAWGEGINYGSPSLEDAIESQMGSPGHCSLMMSKNYKQVGVGCIGGFTVINYGA